MAQQGNSNGLTAVDEQFNKKQIEFKGGKVHQMITDQITNSNEIYAHRYVGMLGLWYFFIDTAIHFENFLAIILIVTYIQMSEASGISTVLPIIALFVNLALMFIRNLSFELRQRKVTNKINKKCVEYLMITRATKRFLQI